MLQNKNFFDNFFDDYDIRKMKCDIYEEKGNYIFEMDVPGYDKKDINIEYDNGTLFVSASKKEKLEEKNDKKYLQKERQSYESIERSFYIGNINEKDIKAEFMNNVLKICVPKHRENNKKLINIE